MDNQEEVIQTPVQTPVYSESLTEEKVEGIGKVEEEQPKDNQFDGVAGDTIEDYERISVAHALGLNDFADMKKFSDQIDRVIEYARLEGAKTKTDYVAKINELQNILGGSGKNIYNLSVYAGLKLEEARIQKQLEGFKK